MIESFHLGVTVLLNAMANAFFNLLCGRLEVLLPPRPVNIRFDVQWADGSVIARTPIQFYWTRLGQTATQNLPSPGAFFQVIVPSLEEVCQALQDPRSDIFGHWRRKYILAKFMEEMMVAAGGSGHPFLRLAGPPDQATIAAYNSWSEACLTCFERTPSLHQRGTILALECAADNMVQIAAAEQRIHELENSALPPDERAAQLALWRQARDGLAKEMHAWLRFACAPQWADSIVPGPDDPQILQFLPAEIVRGLRGPRNPVEEVEEPAEPGEALLVAEDGAVAPAEAEQVPALHFDDIDAAVGFEDVPPEDEILRHPRFQFYMRELGCQRVVKATKWNSKTVAFLFVGKKQGTRLAFVDSSHDGHAACYAFRCGSRDDERETKMRWTTQSQLPRKQVQQGGAQVADTLISKPIRHGRKGSWKELIKRIIAEN